ncbi:ABC transporter substrate-binding protein [Ornithinicoccus hortensis]|uniref:Substrate-binding family protein n=1 Tax=Ornithinicoccus hortensis TaxID=82346 RepID=A0A542YR68_9MICO|nr:ABC transporter substrate-binding protein [Ornithinicoccus hortensis]TQL50558.1 substrate-binding family protein [Ornithinicoccus hortensis]
MAFREWAGGLSALALLALTGCATGEAGASTGPSDEVTVALIAPFTGFSANYGPEAKAGIEIALEDAGYAAGDTEITLITVDEDVLDPSQTLERVKKAVEGDGADVLIGPVFGSSQQAVAPYLSQRKLPMFTFLGGQESLAGERSGFIWPAPDDQTARPLGTYAGEELGYETIATLGPDYAYGHDAMNGAAQAFEATGGTVVQQQWVPLGTTDMLQYATSLDRDVDALVMWLVPTDAAAFVREYRNLGIDIPLLMFQGVFDPDPAVTRSGS